MDYLTGFKNLRSCERIKSKHLCKCMKRKKVYLKGNTYLLKSEFLLLFIVLYGLGKLVMHSLQYSWKLAWNHGCNITGSGRGSTKLVPAKQENRGWLLFQFSHNLQAWDSKLSFSNYLQINPDLFHLFSKFACAHFGIIGDCIASFLFIFSKVGNCTSHCKITWFLVH